MFADKFGRFRANNRESAMSKADLPDLEAMQFDELWRIHEELTKFLSDRILADKRELEMRFAKLHQVEITGPSSRADLNLTAEPPSRRKYPKVLPKYYNPQSPSETWSGRGKRPRWLVAALETGHELDEFKINETQEVEEATTKTEQPT